MMPPSPHRGPTAARRAPARWLALLLLLPVLALGACDSVEPRGEGVLVLEGFLDAERTLPALTVRATQPLRTPYDAALAAVADAAVELELGGRRLPYTPDAARPGRYLPPPDVHVPSRTAFTLRVRHGDQVATAAGSVPPPIAVADVRITPADAPVPAVLLDSLLLQPVVLDSLRFDSLGTGAERGFVYPVEVTVSWLDNLTAADSLFWIRTQLRPDRDVASGLLAFFLRPEGVARERDLDAAGGRRSWTGVYAVPVASAGSPLPPHRLKVSLVRSGSDYARFATSRDAPTRREPRSNVTGGTGIVVGLSVDSARVDVR